MVNWQHSRAHFALLAHFASNSEPPSEDDWSVVLGEPTRIAVARLVKAGALVSDGAGA